ncbi:MAG: hypothetical protein JST04_06515 [Bdellovibrionales bacterium]|nr:hypothetical protein [Bdellovibrionales bacterium]
MASHRFGAILFLFGSVASAFGANVLPYSQRTRAYSGFGTTVRGDNETIGMAGATVAIPNSVSSIETNPAGLTMTMGSVTAQLNSNEMKDRILTGSETKKVRSNQWGLTVTPGDWGYALAYYTPSFEGGDYVSSNTGRQAEYEISLKQLRFSVSRALLNKRLSLAASVEVNHAIRNLADEDHGATDLSYKLGAIYHLGGHYLLGASYSPPQEIGGSVVGSGTPDLPGYAQPIRSPMLLTVGAGWIPNRFFDVGFAVIAVGSTRDTALLRDQSVTVGEGFTLQPRLGASYVVAQYRILKVSLAGGTYYETSRIEGEPNRLHYTSALQVNPWFVNLGIGVDRATNYDNFFVSVGFDVVRLARTFDIIPPEPVPPPNTFWPPPLKRNSDGLPDGLTAGEPQRYKGPSAEDVKEIIENVPTNIEHKVKGLPPVRPSGKAPDADLPDSLPEAGAKSRVKSKSKSSAKAKAARAKAKPSPKAKPKKKKKPRASSSEE